MRMRVTAIVPAAGKGARLKTRTPKPFVPIAGKPLLAHTLARLCRAYPFFEVILVADPSQRRRITALLRRYGFASVRVVDGGKTRAESVQNGVKAASPLSDWVLVHDAARPLVEKGLVVSILSAARKNGAAICALPVMATVKKVYLASRHVSGTPDRRGLYLAQTPQVFRRELLLKRYNAMGAAAFSATDEAALFDGSPVRVAVVPGRPENIKVTTPEDRELCEFYLKRKKVK